MAAAPLVVPGTGSAQQWTVDSGVSASATWSSNAELGSAAGPGRSDTIADVRPYFAIRAEGARLRLGGSASLDAITSAHDTQPSRLLFDADVDGRLEAVQRLLFLEAGVRAAQTSANPFGPRPEPSTTLNTVTTTLVHVAPSLESEIGPLARYRIRSDNSYARDSGATEGATAIGGSGYFGRHTAMIEHDPRPLGWRLEAERSQTRYRDPLQPSFTTDLVRATGRYGFSQELVAGLRVGRDRTTLDAPRTRSTIYGAEVEWHPSPATTLSAFEEKRFFGSSWRLGFDLHRPRFAWNVSLSRDLETSPQALLDRPTNDVLALLDEMFLSRYPDPIERARAVQDFLVRQGLSPSSLTPASLFTERLSVVTRRSASVAFIGVRSTLTLAGFQVRTEDAPGAVTLTPFAAVTNNKQHGASATLAHRLTPTTSLNLAVSWTRISALQQIDRSTEREARLQANVELTPKTRVFVGLRHREFDSNTLQSGKENAVSAGLDHHF